VTSEAGSPRERQVSNKVKKRKVLGRKRGAHVGATCWLRGRPSGHLAYSKN